MRNALHLLEVIHPTQRERFEVDARGLRTARIVTLSTPQGELTSVTRYEHDERGQLVASVQASIPSRVGAPAQSSNGLSPVSLNGAAQPQQALEQNQEQAQAQEQAVWRYAYDTSQRRLQMEGKIRALTAQGKLQAWVVGLLPLVLMLVLNKMEPDAMALLWNTRIGWATLFVIGFLELMGIYVIRKIIAIDV